MSFIVADAVGWLSSIRLHGVLEEIGLSIIIASAVGYVAHRLKQPIILAYLLAGCLLGEKLGVGLLKNPESIELISEIGLVLLLFVIGLELDLTKIMVSGRQLLVAGLGQFVLCVALGLGFFGLLGLSPSHDWLAVLYLSLLASLSSTAIVVKLLYDKFELDTLPGRLTLGILVFQDVWAILILAFQPNFQDPRIAIIGSTVLKGVVLFVVGFFVSKYLLRFVFESVAKSPEMVVTLSIGWCAAVAGVAQALGLSKEMGGLVAGFAISNFPYGIHVSAKVLPLRDFFLTLFFISLGIKIPTLEPRLVPALGGLVLFVVLSRFLSVYPLLSVAGSGRRTCFITSLNLSQVSEFSLVIAALGVNYKHINDDVMTLVLYALAITSVVSSYTIKYSQPLFVLYDRALNRIGWRQKGTEAPEVAAAGHGQHSIVLLGFHRAARAFVESLSRAGSPLLKELLVVDFNPEVLSEMRARNVAAIFGDIGSPDTLLHVHLDQARVILSTIPDMLLKGTNNLQLARVCRSLSPNARIVSVADSGAQIQDLIDAGANDVILPYDLLGDRLAEMVQILGSEQEFDEARN